MKTIILVSLIALVILMSACTRITREECEINIEWEDAIELVQSGEACFGSQLHNRCVSLKTEDGNLYKTREPQIDDIIRINREYEHCNNRGIVTE